MRLISGLPGRDEQVVSLRHRRFSGFQFIEPLMGILVPAISGKTPCGQRHLV